MAREVCLLCSICKKVTKMISSNWKCKINSQQFIVNNRCHDKFIYKLLSFIIFFRMFSGNRVNNTTEVVFDTLYTLSIRVLRRSKNLAPPKYWNLKNWSFLWIKYKFYHFFSKNSFAWGRSYWAFPPLWCMTQMDLTFAVHLTTTWGSTNCCE